VKNWLVVILLLISCKTINAQSYIVYDTLGKTPTGSTVYTGETIFQAFCVPVESLINEIVVAAKIEKKPSQLFVGIYDKDFKIVRNYNNSKEEDNYLHVFDDLNTRLSPGSYFLGVRSNKNGLRWIDTEDGQMAKIQAISCHPVPEPSSYILVLMAGVLCIAVKQW